MTFLHPIIFKTIFKEKLWGGNKISTVLKKNICEKIKTGESWEISCVNNNISVAENGLYKGRNLVDIINQYKGDLLGQRIYEIFGNELPLLIKFIDADEILSVQVHPDDEYANKYLNSHGKNEMWYIIKSEENSKIITGFNKDTSKEEFSFSLKNNSINSLLNFEIASEGDCFFIPAKRIHAIGKGILLAEIQQASDITFRVYDWDRFDLNGKKRDLHLKQAFDVLDFKIQNNYRTKYSKEVNKINNIIANQYFTINFLNLNNNFDRDYSSLDSFVILMCVSGQYEIQTKNFEHKLNYGQTILLPAITEKVNITPIGDCKLLEIYIEIT